MRNQLVPFEGKQVVYEGHLSEWRRRDDEHHICFMNLSVNQFNSNKPLKDGLATCIDHLWMTFDDDFIKDAPKDLYTKRSGLGQVYWYTRGDGTLDLSLKPVGAICLDKYFTFIDEYHHTNYNSHRIKILLDKLSKLFYQYDVENVNCYSTIMVSHPIHEVMEMLRRKVNRIKRDLRSNEERFKTIKNYGKPTGVSLFNTSRTIKKVKVGFA